MQKKTDPERQGAVGHFRSIWQAAFFCQSALLFASCMGTTLTPARQPAAPWPKPGHDVVYDFGTTPDEILLRRGFNNKTTCGDEHCGLGKDVRHKKGVLNNFLLVRRFD